MAFVAPVILEPASNHWYVVAEEEVSVTEPPAQKVVADPAVMVGVVGKGFTVTVVAAEVAEHPKAFVTVTV